MTTGTTKMMNTKTALTLNTSGRCDVTQGNSGFWHFPATLATTFLLTALCTGNALAKKAAPPADQLQPPAGMALIPAGHFLMGNNNDFYDNDFDERPQHVVDLPPFFIDIYPVTNQD